MRFLALLGLTVCVWAAPAHAVEAPDTDRMQAVREAMAKGDKIAAAEALLAIIDAAAAAPAPAPMIREPDPLARGTDTPDPAGAEPVAPPPAPPDTTWLGAAWRGLGELLEAQGYPVSTLIAWTHAIEEDPDGSAGTMSRALAVAERVADTALLAPVLGQNVGIEGLDTETRSKVAYVAALYHLRAGNYGTALGILMMVDKKSKSYADAEALRGIVLSQQGRYGDALAPLLTAQAAARGQKKGAKFDDAMSLNVARAYYANENWGQAIHWFTQIGRTSDYWPEAQFERAWAHFRANDMPGTFALLMSHDTPFFETWYMAEGDLLRAYALFMMCKFPDASKEMDEFVATYTPLKADLDGVLADMTTAEAFADAQAFREGRATRLPAMILRPFRNEDRFGESLVAVEAYEQELALLALGTGKVPERAAIWVQERADARIAEEGERVLLRARAVQTELAEMLEGIEITRLDLLQLEANMYEKAAATGVLDYGDRIGKLRNLRKRKRKHQVWPFQGEYWADEVGWYVVDARPDCPSSMAVGEQPSG